MPRYLELIKARLTSLVLFTTAVGFLISSGNRPDWVRLFLTVVGTGMAAAGANAFNEWMETRLDARMERTRGRPLPAGHMDPGRAFLLALLLSVAGVALLGSLVNAITGVLGALVVILYTLVYTPLKRRTPLCTLVGAVCGAVPPVMGWTGARGSLGAGAWVLAAILFLWQIPHFLALAWLYRADYERGGFRMLPQVDRSGRLTAALAVNYTLALLPMGPAGLLAGIGGWVFLAGSIVLGTGLLVLGLRLRRHMDDRSARRLFLGSIIYLPLVLGLLVADPGPVRHPAPRAAVSVPASR
jgi:heme o synthase